MSHQARWYSGFSTTSFGILRAPALTTYTTPGFQGTGLSQTVLWDPVHPNDFLIGGSGFIGRATITGPGTVTYALLTSNVGTAVQMSWDGAGRVVFADGGTGQVRRLDPATGNVTDLSSGVQPWGTALSAGARNPATGDYIAGGNGAIYRLANGATTATTVVSGLGGYVSGVAFDALTGEIVATVLTSNRLIRVGAGAAVTNLASLSGPNALDLDGNGDWITGGGTGQIWRVPYAGGAPVLLGNHTGPLNGLAVARGGGQALPYGQGCAGAGGIVALRASLPLALGVPITTTSTNHAPGALGVLVLGLSNTVHASQPLPYLLDPLLGTAGCSLHASIDATLVGVAGATTPADLVFALTLPSAFAGYVLFVQHACFEPVAGWLSWSNGLAVQAR